MPKLLSAFMLLCVSGCTVIPTVQYKLIPKNDGTKNDSMKGMTDSFYLQQSAIKLTLETDEKDKSKTTVKVSSTPAEYTAQKYGIKAVTNIRSSTMVNLSKVENTDMIESIGVEVTDNTAKAISDYGGAIASLITTFSRDRKDSNCELKEDLTIKLEDITNTSKDPDEKVNELYTINWDENSKNCLTLSLAPVPVDASKEIVVDENVHNYYYAACRNATITGSVQVDGKPVEVKASFRVSDPRFVQSVQFPPKGKIKHHSQCGVSVITEAVASDNGAAVIKATTEQIKAISDVLKKKEN
ncbi:MAG: hypothetical protein HOP25_06250 [Methylotenera sp.]|nr:hypothetical protein [Methylotenera sp.]